MSKKFLFSSFLIAGVFISAVSCQAAPRSVRIGYFPNLTHAQALVAREKNFFEEKLGKETQIEWTTFNAGPSVIEAVFAGQMDIAFVGPSPAVNGYVKSNGEALRVIAGAASGGSALIVRKDAGIRSAEDFRGKRVASPQFGNTQDVSLRSWLLSQGLESKEKGGDVQVLPVSNADQLSLFLKKELDASWSIEPWVSILNEKADTQIFLEEASLYPGGQYATTLVIVRKKFLDQNPQVVKKFLEGHVEITDWIQKNPTEAKNLINQHLEKITNKRMPQAVLDSAFSRVAFTVDCMEGSVGNQAKAAFKVGFLKKEPELKDLFDTQLLEEVQAGAGIKR